MPTKIQHEIIHSFVMEAIPLCLLLNKPHLFGITQHRFRLIQLDTPTGMLHVSVIF